MKISYLVLVPRTVGLELLGGNCVAVEPRQLVLDEVAQRLEELFYVGSSCTVGVKHLIESLGINVVRVEPGPQTPLASALIELWRACCAPATGFLLAGGVAPIV